MKFFRFLIPIAFLAIFFMPAKTLAAARFYMNPSSGSYKVGDTITSNVMIDSDGQAINAGEATVTFSSDVLEYQSLSTSGSIFTFWTSGPTGGSTQVSFGGGLSNPGYTGSGGKVLAITWKAKSNGSGTVSINNGKILANDGAGTNVYGSSSGATFEVGAATTTTTTSRTTQSVTVKSSSHPDQEKWYQATTLQAEWSGSSGVTQFAFSLDQSAKTDPGSSVSTQKSKTYENLPEGVSYFHIKGKTSTGFTSTVHFRIQIDKTQPEEFSITIDPNGNSSTPKVTFNAKDTLSGVDRAEGSIDGGPTFPLTSGDALPKQRPGDHTLKVVVYDKAGNSRESTLKYTILGIDPPVILDWTKRVPFKKRIVCIGRAAETDTIHVFLNGTEVASFIVKDAMIDPIETTELNTRKWRFVYDKAIIDSNVQFTFSRTTSEGLESRLTQPYDVAIDFYQITIWGMTFSVIRALIVALVLLILVTLALAVETGMLISLHRFHPTHVLSLFGWKRRHRPQDDSRSPPSTR